LTSSPAKKGEKGRAMGLTRKGLNSKNTYPIIESSRKVGYFFDQSDLPKESHFASSIVPRNLSAN
jgi:hypothetical protein